MDKNIEAYLEKQPNIDTTKQQNEIINELDKQFQSPEGYSIDLKHKITKIVRDHANKNILDIPFSAYEQILNMNEKSISMLSEEEKDGEWCTMEKVHGANFNFSTNGTSIYTGKRTSFLNEGDKFFHWTDMHEKYEKILLQIFHEIKNTIDPNIEYIYFYAELFGGSYPHKSVPRNPGTSGIQKRLYYSPNYEVIFYDIKIKQKGGQQYYIDYDVALSIFKHYSLFSAEILFSGNFSDVIKQNPVFLTTISERLGYPPIKDNFAEGLVLKKIKGSRPILKNKNPTFDEKNSVPINKNDTMIEEKLAKIYVTRNRLDSVLSKEFEDHSIKQFRDITLKLSNDAINECLADPIDVEYDLNKLRRTFGKYSGTIVKEYFAEKDKE